MPIILASNVSNRVSVAGVADPVQGKQGSGIARYGTFFGWILSLFGWAIQLKDGNKTFYINRRSAIKWLSRHNVYLADKTSSQQIASKIHWLASTVGLLPQLQQVPAQDSNKKFKEHLDSQLQRLRAGMEKAIDKNAKENNAAGIFHLRNQNSLNQTEALFTASEALLDTANPLPLEAHPLFQQLSKLGENGSLTTTMASGPTIQDMTTIMLGRYLLDPTAIFKKEAPKLDIFNNAETFLRCFDIFKRKYEEKIGKTIGCELSLALSHTPLDVFCEYYIQHYPELAKMPAKDLEKFIRLLSIFNVDNDIVELGMTFKLTVKIKDKAKPLSFKPINDIRTLKKTTVQGGSNDISQGQQNLDKQIQNLGGSELSMPYIKDVDCAVQFQALQSVMNRKKMRFVDIGGGRGENNALLKVIRERGVALSLLNVEPYAPFAEPYIEAGKGVHVEDITVLQKYSQDLTAVDVINHFNGERADVVFASHSFYFSLGDMHKATQAYVQDKAPSPLSQHPMAKYFEMIKDDGVIILTLQSGAGARLFRNALLGNHGLNPSTAAVADETVPLLSSFGNLATFFRHLNVFIQRYQKETGKIIQIKTRHAVANVPLGNFKIERDALTGGYLIRNPDGEDNDPNWLAPKMLDFYGNWKELQALATMTSEKAKKINGEGLNKLGLENCAPEQLIEKRKAAIKAQEVFLQILRVFAPGMKNMQHPNITLEMRVSR